MTESGRVRGRPAIGGWPARFAGVLALIALTGCGGDQPSEGGGEMAAVSGGTVVIAEGADLSKPNPLVSESALDNSMMSMLYRPLLEPIWEDGTLVFLDASESPMALARSVEFFGPDSASLRYHLRSDVSWSDGEPVTAHDAAWTLKAQGNPEVASPRQDYSREIREIVVEDDSTLVIHFTRRYPEMFFHTAGEVVPAHVYEGSDLSQMRSHPSLTNPVENLVSDGPFRLVEWRRGQEVVLERSPDFEPQPKLDRIVFRIIPEQTTRMVELQTGGIDMTTIPFQSVEQVRASDNLRIETQEMRSYEYVSYNPQAHDFFADPEIRRALGLAIDVPAIIAGLQMEDFAVPAGGPYPPIFRLLYDPEGQAPLPYDTVEAKRILAEKGWTPGPDGILQKDGVPFHFTILTNAENQRRMDVGQILKEQWLRLGVDADLQTLEFNTVVARSREKDYEARIGGWNVGLSADLYSLWGDPDLPFNDVSYDNAEVQRLFAEALDQPTSETAAPYWREAASLITADQPYTWLYYYDSLYAVNDRLQGLRIDTLGPYQQPWAWYIAE